jgi:hypothetical protein
MRPNSDNNNNEGRACLDEEASAGKLSPGQSAGTQGIVHGPSPFGWAGQPAINLSGSSELHGSVIAGTVDAAILSGADHDYGYRSEALISGAPLAATRQSLPPEPVRPQLRAKDLVDEIRNINTQIHRIMSQVERAVARLATSMS